MIPTESILDTSSYVKTPPTLKLPLISAFPLTSNPTAVTIPVETILCVS